MRKQEPSDIRALAKAINARRNAYMREHGRKPAITPAMSRLLALDEEYAPYRQRKRQSHARSAVNPSIATLVDIAARLDTSVGALLGEKAYRIGIAERRELRRILLVLFRLLDLNALEVRGVGGRVDAFD